MKSTAFCTICSQNYIAFARTLMRSLQETTPDADRCVLLVDKNSGHIDPDQENFHVTWVEDLQIADFKAMAFQYTVTELNTAVKPLYLQYLFQQGYQKVVYLDPDIYAYRSLNVLFERLRDNHFLLTPHILSPMPDDQCLPDEPFILISGLYNLGFIGLAACDDVAHLLDWWAKKLKNQCIMDHARGLFVDQQWMDLTPIFYSQVDIIKDKGFNAAYWNLHERLPVTWDAEQKPMVAGTPLYFYHFSGIHMDDPTPISKYQNRFTLNADPDGLRRLFEAYRSEVLKHGHAIAKQWAYTFANFDNGVRINSKMRRRFLNIENKSQFGNPFDSSSNQSFYAHCMRLSQSAPLGKRILGKLLSVSQHGRPSSKT